MAESQSRVSALMSRFMLALRAGMQFQGARDLYQVFGYSRLITPEMLLDKYNRQDIAASLIDKPADALWTNPPTVKGPDDFTNAWKELTSKNDIWSPLLRADKLLGIYPYVVLLLGMEGNVESAAKNAKNLFYLQPFGSSSAEITGLYSDISKSTFGKPSKYTIKYADQFAGAKIASVTKTLDVHESRCVLFTNEPLESNLSGSPRLLKGYNLLEDLIKITGGSAETFWLTANRGMQVDVDKDMDLTSSDAEALTDELDEFQHQLRRYIRTRGVKVNVLGSDVADPRGVFDVLISLLSGTYGIPQRILLGSEAGQLASEQDRANWADAVVARRTTFAEPCILRPLIERLINCGILPSHNNQLTFEWPDAFHLSPLEKAQTMAQTARAVVNLSRQAQFGTPITTTEEARSVIGLEGTAGLPEVTSGIPPKEPSTSDSEEDDMEEDKAEKDQNSQGK